MRRVHYAWVILGLCFFGRLAARGTRLSFGAFSTLSAPCRFFLLAVDRPEFLFAFGIVFGFVDFAVLAPLNVFTSRYFSGQSLRFTFGVLSLCHQVGSTVGAFMPGLLYTLTGSYTVSFVVAASGLLVGSALSMGLPSTVWQRRNLESFS